MPHTERQLHALEALDWLLDIGEDYRASGRTHIIAVALIRQALRHPRQRIPYLDHWGFNLPVRQAAMRELIVRLIDMDEELSRCAWDIARENFRVLEPTITARMWNGEHLELKGYFNPGNLPPTTVLREEDFT
jgi:hypothetical protein